MGFEFPNSGVVMGETRFPHQEAFLSRFGVSFSPVISYSDDLLKRWKSVGADGDFTPFLSGLRGIRDEVGYLDSFIERRYQHYLDRVYEKEGYRLPFYIRRVQDAPDYSDRWQGLADEFELIASEFISKGSVFEFGGEFVLDLPENDRSLRYLDASRVCAGMGFVNDGPPNCVFFDVILDELPKTLVLVCLDVDPGQRLQLHYGYAHGVKQLGDQYCFFDSEPLKQYLELSCGISLFWGFNGDGFYELFSDGNGGHERRSLAVEESDVPEQFLKVLWSQAMIDFVISTPGALEIGDSLSSSGMDRDFLRSMATFLAEGTAKSFSRVYASFMAKI